MKMRRSDREITDSTRIDEIITACHCCRLGLCDAGEVYIVPLNFGFSHQDGKRVFYFHSAHEGRKLALIASSPKVSFELDTGYKLNEGNTACQYSAQYVSVMGTGTVSLLEQHDDKRLALSAIMNQCAGSRKWEFTDAEVNAVCTLKLEVDTISCKEHR